MLELRNAPVITLPEEPNPSASKPSAPAPVVTINTPVPKLDTAVALPAPTNRATEIAERARRLLARTNRLQEHIQSRTRASSVANLIEEKATYESSQLQQSRVEHLYGIRETSRGVLFVHPGTPSSSICIAGDFNNWNPATTKLKYNTTLGLHEACVPLRIGMHEYRLVVDGRWIADPFNTNSVTNPFGERNSVVVVTKNPQITVPPEAAD